MALRISSARRTTDRMEDVAARVLIAAGLLVVLFSYGVGAQLCNQGLERAQVESGTRPDRGPAPLRRSTERLREFEEQHRGSAGNLAGPGRRDARRLGHGAAGPPRRR